MKRKVMLSVLVLVAVVAGSVAGTTLSGLSRAQPGTVGSAPAVVRYQGTLLDAATGDPVADGGYQFLFSIYDVATGGTALWSETQTVTVADGVFSVLLGSVSALSAGDFAGSPRYLGIKVGTDAEMTPRQLLATAPYAFQAEQAANALGIADDTVTVGKIVDGAVTAAKLAEAYYTQGEADTRYVNVTGDTMTGPLDVNGNIQASGTVKSGTSIVIDGVNDRIVGDQDLELHTGSGRALRLEDDATSPNLIGGYSANSVTTSVVGATVGGGGESGGLNRVTDDFGTVGGGSDNQAGDNAGTTTDCRYATVGGGYENTASGDSATVGGGESNEASDFYATVAGGWDNTASHLYATVGGGYYNAAGGECATVAGGVFNEASGYYATVAGGYDSAASDYYATVAGGHENFATGYAATVGGGESNEASYSHATVGGGYLNTASGDSATVGGGYENTASGYSATVGGGRGNAASDNYPTVGGGYLNTASGNTAAVGGGDRNIASGESATVGGGYSNEASGDYAMAAGGYDNTASGLCSFAAGRQAAAAHEGCFVWGDSTPAAIASTGDDQFIIRASGGVGIGTNSPDTALDVDGDVEASGTIKSGSSIVIDGGNDRITADQDLELHAGSGRALRLEQDPTSPNLIGGSSANSVFADVVGAAIGGGGAASYPNRVTDDYGTVGGGWSNVAGDTAGTMSDRPSATVGGGYLNTASGSSATVGGGYYNEASGSYATVGGGDENTASGGSATVAGGYSNEASNAYATVGGGYDSTASAHYTTVAGGYSNSASSNSATVGGGYSNAAGGNTATVAGGWANTASGSEATVAGGESNEASNAYAAVGGGYDNTASAYSTTVAGGYMNEATGYSATVAGGYSNDASGDYGVVGGGENNDASGSYAMVAGGYLNHASGDYSFAAGLEATAGHDGCFVWGDSSGVSTASTATNQFMVRANGGFFVQGLSSTSSYSLARIDSATGRFYIDSSSERYKEDIQDLEGDFHSILDAEPRSYIDTASGQREIGYIAEELDEMGLTDLVVYNGEGEPAGLKYDRIPLYLVEIIEEQQAQIENLLQRVEALEELNR